MSENKEVVVGKNNPEVNEPKSVDNASPNLDEADKEILSPEEEARIAEEKVMKSAKRKGNFGKAVKGTGVFLWKTLNIKVLFIIIFAILMFVAGFYAGEENYKRVLRIEYEKAIEDFADTWEEEWKEAFED